jgi:hypothetical protein
MTVSEQRLADMQEDLNDYIGKFIIQRKLDVPSFAVRTPLLTEPEIGKYNTCMSARKLFHGEFKCFIDLDESYGNRDIYTLAKKFVRFLDTNQKKDACQIAIMAKAIKKAKPKLTQKVAYEKAVLEFKEMKQNEQDTVNANSTENTN